MHAFTSTRPSDAFRRPIRVADATAGISDRAAFLRRTYGYLGGALITFALISGGMMAAFPQTSLALSRWALGGPWSWLLVLGLFMLVGYAAERLAWSATSRALQHVGLGLAVLAQGLLVQPLLWTAIGTLGAASALAVIAQATTITLAVFVGLTATAFLSRRDFSFLRGALVIASFAALGTVLAAALFGFSLGAVFAGAMILLMAGYILFQTSMVMKDFPPTAHVAAALMLFSTVATLFWYVLQLLMSLRRD